MKSDATITVLAVSSSADDQASLGAIFTHSRWQLFQVTSTAEAISLLQSNPMPVVVCDANLPDGTWRDLLAYGASLPNPPLLIVASHLADDQLWVEALNLGAHDVLAKPFHAREVFQSVSLAWRRWKDLSVSSCSSARWKDSGIKACGSISNRLVDRNGGHSVSTGVVHSFGHT